MPPLFHPHLVNCPFEDPGLYVDFLFERRAVLFDLGDTAPLPPRKVLRLSHIFVSHTHVDHFIGFDRVVRLCLGREKRLHLVGPPGFVDRVTARLGGYTWNLVGTFPTDFTVAAAELHPDGSIHSAEFHYRAAFSRENEQRDHVHGGVLLDEEAFRVRSVFLDHGIPCLAFALEEKNHVHILKNRLREAGLPTGPWLAELKRAILGGRDDGEPFTVWWREEGQERGTRFSLGELRERFTKTVAGQKIVYVTDAAPTPENRRRIVELAAGADYLFIEAPFLDEERERAGDRCHLTARVAGELGRDAGVARVVPFHFSPRYTGRESLLREEVERAFRG